MNNEYNALLSNFHLIFPKYLLNIIKLEYERRSKAEKVLVEYLNVLEATFMAIKAAPKLKV